ncbi:hypothetical protein CHU92_08705 [Flavobacterium cyanobacteriorum]|uniref:Lipocalin-like domain-containing protein n=1 Tax=Flavobacterium cyanobacteriorum TaxID=2022802 RepID=A0A255Z6V4_9FLAO|nr:lipocalin family protein [Flavobacterium cyanobacteriorum]OYQ37208.1 hypothetical protein CHU92_08705 [Flavobacterium cyanobacteriorum]
MKKQIKLLKMKCSACLLLLLLIFTACSDDDGNRPAIFGKWKLESETYNGQPSTLSECNRESTVEFRTGGTVIFTYHSSNPLNGSCISGEPQLRPWTRDSNLITVGPTDFDPSYFTDYYTIISLTNETLTWERALSGGTIIRESYSRQ